MPIEEWRELASQVRLHVLDNLAEYVNRFERNAVRAGATIHRAKDAEAAREIVWRLLKEHGIRKVVKSKSMINFLWFFLT